MLVLAIDTAADSCALALHKDGKPLDETVIPTERDQAKILAPLTQTLLEKNNLKTTDITRFAIATGPGSFTGLRVGLSFVRGLALANNKNAFGFDHFEITQHIARNAPPTLIIRESKRADLFCAWLKSGQLQPYFLSTADALLGTLSTGDGYKITGNGAHHVLTLQPDLKNAFVEYSDGQLINALAELTARAKTEPQEPPQPLYLRGADVSFPKQATHNS